MLQDLKAERFLRPEVVGERPLRHARGLDDVADAGAAVPLFEHHLQTGLQEFFAMRWLRHTFNMSVRIKKCKAHSSRIRRDGRCATNRRRSSLPPSSIQYVRRSDFDYRPFREGGEQTQTREPDRLVDVAWRDCVRRRAVSRRLPGGSATEHGRDIGTPANERASNRGKQTSA